jgi:hypothetical protein
MNTRSIIGPGFEDWVQKQITTRQEKNRLANRDRETLMYQNTNTAWLLLSSGVNIATSFDENGKPTGYDGGVEASRYTLYNTQFTVEDSNGNLSNTLASGVGIGALNTAYGFQSTPDYGFVPPPGLTSADIKSLNRGALREATVNLVCHSATQFEIIDQLYLRLGYSMLLEWGWSKYFDNDSNLQDGAFSNTGIFLTDNTTQETLLQEIQKQRQESNGNYDAMFGLVKNFSWSLEKDGSYNITLHIVSVGDVIESIKQNTSHPTSIQKTSTDQPENQPPLQYNADKSSLNKIFYYLSNQLPPQNISINGGWNSYLQGNQTTADIIGSLIGLTPNQRNDRPNSQGDVIAFIFPQLLGINSGATGQNAQYFMKLGLLLRSIQNFVLLYNTSSPDGANNVPSLFNINFEEEENFMFTFPRHGSLDPRVCLIDVLSDLTGTVGQDPNQKSYVGSVNAYKWYTINIVPDADYHQGIPTQGEEKILDPSQTTPDHSTQTLVGNYFNFSGTVVPPSNFGANATEQQQTQTTIDNLVRTYTPSSGFVKKTEQVSTIPLTSTDIPVLASNANNMAWLQSQTQDPLAAALTKFTNNTDLGNFDSEVVNTATSGKYSGPYPWNIGEGKEAIIATNNLLASSSIIKTQKFSTTEPGTGGTTINRTYTVNIKEYTIQTVTITTTSTGYIEGGLNNGGEEGVDTKNNLFNNIRPGINFRIDKDNHPFIGRTMNMYVNMNYAAKTLEQFTNPENGNISVYDFLERLMSGIQQALGNVNNFNISYDETTNTFSIIDSTFIPGLDSYKPEEFKNPPVEFITHTLDSTAGSFMRDASVKTQLSNNFATQVTIGAQANGNVVGENATALSRWNVGLVDRVILTKDSLNEGGGDVTTSNIDQKFYTNVGIVQNLYRFIDDGNITDQQIDGSRDAAVDLFKYEIGLYTKEGYIPGVGFIPINLELTMDGLSGMKIYESYTADTRLLPPRYKDAIQFIITGVSHKIQSNDWTTTITSISGPKYNGFKSNGSPPPVKTHSLQISSKTKDTKNSGPDGNLTPGNNNIQANGTPSTAHEKIVLKAIQAAFSQGQTNGQCARGSGTFAINVVDILNGGKGREMREGDSGGTSAKDSKHHQTFINKGWKPYSWNNLTKAQLKDYIENGPPNNSGDRVPWVAGDVVCYWNTDGNGSHFHSQYYQNKLYTNYKWATDNDNNYKTSFVYNRTKANSWDLVVLKIPILG